MTCSEPGISTFRQSFCAPHARDSNAVALSWNNATSDMVTAMPMTLPQAGLGTPVAQAKTLTCSLANVFPAVKRRHARMADMPPMAGQQRHRLRDNQISFQWNTETHSKIGTNESEVEDNEARFTPSAQAAGLDALTAAIRYLGQWLAIARTCAKIVWRQLASSKVFVRLRARQKRNPLKLAP